MCLQFIVNKIQTTTNLFLLYYVSLSTLKWSTILILAEFIKSGCTLPEGSAIKQ